MSGNSIMHDCGINNYYSLCGSEASMFTIDVAVHDDDDDQIRVNKRVRHWMRHSPPSLNMAASECHW